MTVPTGFRYSRKHAWITPLEDGTAAVGVTHYFLSTLGEVTAFDVPDIGTWVHAGEPVGVMDGGGGSAETADIFSPVLGEVVEVNGDAVESPEQLNDTPYVTWLFKLKLADPAAIDELLTAHEYQKLIDS